MTGLVDAIACGILSALTWAGLVWMSPSELVQGWQAWWQSFVVVAIANALVWIGLASLKLPVVIWVIAFLGFNVLVSKFVLPYLRNIYIPDTWSLIVLPSAIATMNILLGGALGAI